MKYPIFFRGIHFFLFFLVCLNLIAQTNDFNPNSVKETIQIETDRDLYFVGENVFFSISYFVNESRLGPTISQVVYLELINCRNNHPVVQKKIKVADFKASGALLIPNSLPTGNYLMRAYTQYQRNFSASNFRSRLLTILNPEDRENYLSLVAEPDSVEIVPEGNVLLDNIQNTVVIRVPTYWLAKDNSYQIVTGASQIVDTLKIPQTGVTQIEFTGSRLQEYYFLMVKSNGDTLRTAFPEIQTEGIQTTTLQVGDNITYSIQKVGSSVNTQSDFRLKVLGNDFYELFTEDIEMSGNTFETKVPTERLVKGINYLVLSDVSDSILKINSIFIPNVVSEIELSGIINTYSCRDTVKAQMRIDDYILDQEPFVTIAVTKHKTKRQDHDSDLSLYLNSGSLLSDFFQYNTNLSQVVRNQTMVLFDKRVNRKQVAEKIKYADFVGMKYIPEIYGLSMSGVIRSSENKAPVAGQNIFASVLFNNPQLHVSKSNENGEFIFTLNNVKGVTKVFLCPENSEKGPYEILISNPFSGEYPAWGEIPAFGAISDTVLINEMYRNLQINTHFYPTTDPEPNVEVQRNSFNIDSNKSTIKLADFVGLKNMEELFTEIVPTVKYVKRDNSYAFAVFDENGNVFSHNPLVLMDRIPVFDLSKIMELDISLVKMIEVINTTYILGENTFQGVVMLSSNTSDFAGIEFPGSSVFVDFRSVENIPNHAGYPSPINGGDKHFPDFRTTLFWNPGIKLTGNLYDFSFLTSDDTGIYDVEIKGYTNTGERIYGRTQISVR